MESLIQSGVGRESTESDRSELRNMNRSGEKIVRVIDRHVNRTMRLPDFYSSLLDSIEEHRLLSRQSRRRARDARYVTFRPIGGTRKSRDADVAAGHGDRVARVVRPAPAHR